MSLMILRLMQLPRLMQLKHLSPEERAGAMRADALRLEGADAVQLETRARQREGKGRNAPRTAQDFFEQEGEAHPPPEQGPGCGPERPPGGAVQAARPPALRVPRLPPRPRVGRLGH